MSFLSVVGKDFKAVFAWLGSSKGQAVVTGVEGVGEAVATAAGLGAPVQAGINLINNWLAEIIKAQALGEAAAATGTATGDVTKAATVLAALAPQVVAFSTQYGLPAPTAASLDAINTNLVAVLDALGAPAAPPASNG